MKVCCIGSIEEARLAVRHGASAVGLVTEMPSGPGVIREPLIAEIARTVPPTVGSFLLCLLFPRRNSMPGPGLALTRAAEGEPIVAPKPLARAACAA